MAKKSADKERKTISIESWDNITVKKMRAGIIPILKKIKFDEKGEKNKAYAIKVLNSDIQTSRKITRCLNIMDELIHQEGSIIDLEIKFLTLQNSIYS